MVLRLGHPELGCKLDWKLSLTDLNREPLTQYQLVHVEREYLLATMRGNALCLVESRRVTRVCGYVGRGWGN